MICFDLEGPLSGQDNAYDVMALIDNGDALFEAISEYDDILALERKQGYEPGDTLKLVIPFFIYHGISENDIRRVSANADLVSGMTETINWLKEHNIPVRIISTSYQQHAYLIGSRLGVHEKNIASTKLSLSEIVFDDKTLSLINKLENTILKEGLNDKTRSMLDDIYFKKGLFDKIKVKVIGGQRKVDALFRFAKEKKIEISNVAAVGDSITDFKMLEAVKKGGGLAIAFNANKYCLPHADVSVATMDGRALLPLFNAFYHGGREEALDLVGEFENAMNSLEPDFSFLQNINPQPIYNLINGEGEMNNIISIHKEMRMKVRGEAGKLG